MSLSLFGIPFKTATFATCHKCGGNAIVGDRFSGGDLCRQGSVYTPLCLVTRYRNSLHSRVVPVRPGMQFGRGVQNGS